MVISPQMAAADSGVITGTGTSGGADLTAGIVAAQQRMSLRSGVDRMAFFQYLVFDGENLPLPDSYEVELEDVEADSSGETEAGTTQRDVVRHGVVRIPVSFSVTAKWLKKLAGYAKKDKIIV